MNKERIKRAAQNVYVEPVDFKEKVKTKVMLSLEKPNKKTYLWRYRSSVAFMILILVVSLSMILFFTPSITNNKKNPVEENDNSKVDNPENDPTTPGLPSSNTEKDTITKVIIYPEKQLPHYSSSNNMGSITESDNSSSPDNDQINDLTNRFTINTITTEIISMLKGLNITSLNNEVIMPVNMYLSLNILEKITNGLTHDKVIEIITSLGLDTTKDYGDTLNRYLDNMNQNCKLQNTLVVNGDYTYDFTVANPLAVNYRLTIIASNFNEKSCLNTLLNNLKLTTADQYGNKVADLNNLNVDLKLLSFLTYDDLWPQLLEKTNMKFNNKQVDGLIYKGSAGYLETGEFILSKVETASQYQVLLVKPLNSKNISSLWGKDILNNIIYYNKNLDYSLKNIQLTFPSFTLNTRVDTNSLFNNTSLKELLNQQSDYQKLINEGTNKLLEINQYSTLMINQDGLGSIVKTNNKVNKNIETEMSIDYDETFMIVIMKGNLPLLIGVKA